MGKPVTSMAASADLLAVAVEGEGIRIESPDGASSEPIRLDALGAPCVTAMAFADSSTLLVAVANRDRNPAHDWKRDLMTKTAAGSIWRIDIGTRTAVSIASGLAFPSGIIVSKDRLFVSEAWRHRVISMGIDGSPNRSPSARSRPIRGASYRHRKAASGWPCSRRAIHLSNSS